MLLHKSHPDHSVLSTNSFGESKTKKKLCQITYYECVCVCVCVILIIYKKKEENEKRPCHNINLIYSSN